MNQLRSLDNARILVTGGLGFIGSNFIHYMLAKHSTIHITNIDMKQFKSASKHAGAPVGLIPQHMNTQDIHRRYGERYVLHECDINASHALEMAWGTGFDYIVNFAAESHNSRAELEPVTALNNSVAATLRLFERIRKCAKDGIGRSLRCTLHISTCEVYGQQELGEGVRPFVESDPLCPRTKYNIAKADADNYVQSYVRDDGIPAITTRCCNVLGPYQVPEKVIPKATNDFLSGKKITMYQASDYSREWIYVLDKCRALELLLTHGALGEVYNIGTGIERSVKDVVGGVLGVLRTLKECDEEHLKVARDTVRNAFGLFPDSGDYRDDPDEQYIQIVEGRKGHDKRYLLDSSKIRQLGWAPEFSFEDGLWKTVLWYINNREWSKAFLLPDLERK